MVGASLWVARRLASCFAGVLLAVTLASCSGGGGSLVPPPPQDARLPGGGTQTELPLQAYDVLTGGPCDISYDGLVWYMLPAGPFPPVDARFARCSAPAALSVNAAPSMPAWATPAGATQAIFIATSLMERPYSPEGVAALHAVATAARVPVTWMIGNVMYLQAGNYEIFNAYHKQDGDDVEMEDNREFIVAGPKRFPWYAPTVSVEGAGRERQISQLLSFGERGFWGITWNSLHVDYTSDMGAPWGTYCADVSSYKRPSPTGNCTLVAFEWTARDLTRAYFTGHEEYYSTDPDDVLERAQFGVTAGSQYVRSLVDAYAAAGEFQPLVMMSQQEAPEMISGASGDAAVLGALYQEAVKVGMKPMTLASALPLARSFSNQPRAIAFPFIPGGRTILRNGSALDPSTIDYHDNAAGMTFAGGHTTPSRLFLYSQDPVSVFNQPLVQLPAAELPQLTMVAVSGGKMYFHFHSSIALHYGVALWGDPTYLGVWGPNVSISGHAGAVVAFDLPAGDSDQAVVCARCVGTALPLSL
jgi:hypothetical protein